MASCPAQVGQLNLWLSHQECAGGCGRGRRNAGIVRLYERLVLSLGLLKRPLASFEVRLGLPEILFRLVQGLLGTVQQGAAMVLHLYPRLTAHKFVVVYRLLHIHTVAIPGIQLRSDRRLMLDQGFAPARFLINRQVAPGERGQFRREAVLLLLKRLTLLLRSCQFCLGYLQRRAGFWW